MKYELRVRAAARRDIVESHAWYAEQSESAAERFSSEMDGLFARIVENPYLYPNVYRDVHRALTRRFPYAIYFVVKANRISVLRVLHQARDPRQWP